MTATESPLPTTRRRRALTPLLAALLLGGAGAAWLAAAGNHESTDDAYLRADDTSIAPQVKGRVLEVLVRDHQRVRTGAALLRLDPDDLAARTRAAEADLLGARANVQAAHAALASLDAEEALAQAQIGTVQAGIVAARARVARTAAEQARHERLALAGAVAQRELELARTGALDARADADRTTAQLAVTQRQLALTRTRRAGLRAALAQAQAGVARADAALALARQEQNHAVITAPVDGAVGALQVHRGDVVQPGSVLMTLVPLERLYVVAYFKETQSERILAGQAVQLEVDALRGQTLRGTVESFAPGTGAQFSLLPFEPGTGNFTKIVQRVPVRIALDGGQEQWLAKLRPGLSVTARVAVR
ncbi:transporter [Duganella sp. Leaf126]|uniref:HlyD family secretion protein n=1 Tax=Duganella sp. Leaf126 TaxID=1736266 RepID=UPI0006FCD45C|nr:HlyD family secretion protein [Duganella sp. Leaf126]KQQ40272.1 transporter [Duganella sp. Leaf126]